MKFRAGDSVAVFALTMLLSACGGAAPTASSPAPAATTALKPSPGVSAPASVAGASAKPSGASATGGPAGVAQRWAEVLSKSDTANLGTLYTDDAVWVGGPPCNIRTACKGPDGVAKRVQAASAGHIQASVAGASAVVGNVVQWRQEERDDNTKAAGVDRRVILVQATVRDGKIALQVGFPDLSDAQTNKALSNAQQAGSAQAKPAASGSTDPATVVTRWIDALNKGDAAGAAAMFSGDAVMGAGGPPCTAARPCTGDQIQARFQAAAGANYTVVGSPYVAGNMVQVRRELRNANAKAAGVERFVDWHQEMVVADKIATEVGFNDITDPQTATYTQWQQSQPVSAPPKPAASA